MTDLTASAKIFSPQNQEPPKQQQNDDPARALEHMRILEALLFASPAPLAEKNLAQNLPPRTDIRPLLLQLQRHYANRGVNLRRVGSCWALRSAPDLAYLFVSQQTKRRNLSRAAMESLTIIAYHQPVTRSEIEKLRGVSLGKNTLDRLIDLGWVKLGRRQSPGRPLTFATTEKFLDHFGLESLRDLPQFKELRAAGYLSDEPPAALPLFEDQPGQASEEETLW